MHLLCIEFIYLKLDLTRLGQGMLDLVLSGEASEIRQGEVGLSSVNFDSVILDRVLNIEFPASSNLGRLRSS